MMKYRVLYATVTEIDRYLKETVFSTSRDDDLSEIINRFYKARNSKEIAQLIRLRNEAAKLAAHYDIDDKASPNLLPEMHGTSCLDDDFPF